MYILLLDAPLLAKETKISPQQEHLSLILPKARNTTLNQVMQGAPLDTEVPGGMKERMR